MREHPLAVGARHKVIGWNRLFGEIESLSFHHEVRAAVRAVVAERDEALRCVNKDAVLVVCEMGPASAAGGQNQIRFSTLGRDPEEIAIGGLPPAVSGVFTG